MSDSRPVDKINFIRTYAKTREEGFTERNIRSGWRVTGNWPISRLKALSHPEIHSDQAKSLLISSPPKAPYFGSDDTPKTSRHIRDLGRNKSPHTRNRYSLIAKGFDNQDMKISAHEARIRGLEEEIARLIRYKKRKAIPNPNAKFINFEEILASGEAISDVICDSNVIEAEQIDSEEEAVASEAASIIEYIPPNSSPIHTALAMRPAKK